MDNKIEIRNVDKFYGRKQALENVNLTISQGMFGLLGRNGAGKTTLMKTLATLHKKQKGKITVCGIPVENAKEIRSITGYLPQDFSMYPTMTVEESLDYLGILSGMDGETRKKRIKTLLKRVNLTEHRHKKVKALSGGMKRRLGIAQALLHEPRVLIVDEPTAGLDPKERIRIRNLIAEIAFEKIVIIATHVVSDIEFIAKEVLLLKNGEIIGSGKPHELCEKISENVFEITTDEDSLPEISAKFKVGNISKDEKNIYVRVISENPPADYEYKACKPDLEDLYLYYFD